MIELQVMSQISERCLGSRRASFRRHVLTFFASFAFLTSTWENCDMLRHPSNYVAVAADICSIYIYTYTYCIIYIYMCIYIYILYILYIHACSLNCPCPCHYHILHDYINLFDIFCWLPDLPDITDRKSEVDAVKDVGHEIVIWLPVIMVPRNGLMP